MSGIIFNVHVYGHSLLNIPACTIISVGYDLVYSFHQFLIQVILSLLIIFLFIFLDHFLILLNVLRSILGSSTHFSMNSSSFSKKKNA